MYALIIVFFDGSTLASTDPEKGPFTVPAEGPEQKTGALTEEAPEAVPEAGGAGALSGGPPFDAQELPTLTKEMLSGSRVIAQGRRIGKVDELVRKFGGKARDWAKKSTVDPRTGQEVHWYEHPGLPRVGLKRAGEPDPF